MIAGLAERWRMCVCPACGCPHRRPSGGGYQGTETPCPTAAAGPSSPTARVTSLIGVAAVGAADGSSVPAAPSNLAAGPTVNRGRSPTAFEPAKSATVGDRFTWWLVHLLTFHSMRTLYIDDSGAALIECLDCGDSVEVPPSFTTVALALLDSIPDVLLAAAEAHTST